MKNNVKSTWKLINEILNKQVKQSDYPDIFKNEEGTPDIGYRNIANTFNDFLIKLASKIENVNIYDYLTQTNNNSMCLNPVDNQEIIDIVHECKNKLSENYDVMNMNTAGLEISGCPGAQGTEIFSRAPRFSRLNARLAQRNSWTCLCL